MMSITNPMSQVITPQDVKGTGDGFDYDRLVTEFGIEPISNDLIDRIERLTNKKVGHTIRRQIINYHVDMTKILDAYEKGIPFYIYTGRGPSAPHLHLGHIIPLKLTKDLQDLFDVYVVIQISDDEKLYYKKDLTEAMVDEYSRENIKDIISIGFNPEKTYIFRNTETMGTFYPFIMRMLRLLNINQLNNIYGFDTTYNPGQLIYPCIQATPAFSQAFQKLFHGKNLLCLIPAAVDQTPYFRMARDLAMRLKLPKPCMILGKFLPALEGIHAKMSSSVKSIEPIYITDTEIQIKKKIMKAFSGGGDTAELQRLHGANLDIDIAYQYLRFFEEDDKILNDIADKYSSGQMLTGEVKMYLIGKIVTYLRTLAENRARIDDEILRKFTDAR